MNKLTPLLKASVLEACKEVLTPKAWDSQDLHIFGVLETTSTTIFKKKTIGTMNQPKVSKKISTTARREMSLFLKMEQDTKVNGKTTFQTVKGK